MCDREIYRLYYVGATWMCNLWINTIDPSVVMLNSFVKRAARRLTASNRFMAVSVWGDQTIEQYSREVLYSLIMGVGVRHGAVSGVYKYEY